MSLSVFITTSDPLIKNQLTPFFEEHGISVTSESVASKALLKLVEENFDFFVLDLASEVESNLDLIGVVKRIKPRLPIIVLSKSTNLKTIRSLSEAGAFYCALKPVQIPEMEKVVEIVIRFYRKEKAMEHLYKKHVP